MLIVNCRKKWYCHLYTIVLLLLVGFLFYKYPLPYDRNCILFCNLYVMSFSYEVRYQTVLESACYNLQSSVL